jgi:hypothetical protein
MRTSPRLLLTCGSPPPPWVWCRRRFSAPEAFAPFELAPGLYYNNALENAASAQEVSIVAAANNVLLARQHVQQRGCRPGAGLLLQGGPGEDHQVPELVV